MSENYLAKAELNELETALAGLTSTELHILARLVELHPLEDIPDILDAMDGEDAAARFIQPDPYARCERVLPEGRAGNYRMGEDGRIRVKNLSAYWIPELTVTEAIAGTVYTVTGSYEGDGSFLRKLERIIAQNFAAKLEDSE